MLLPFVWMLSTSLKPADQLFTVPPTWLPQPLQWDTYVKAMSAGNFGRYALNSLLLGVANMVTNVLLSALAGYAFARLRFPGRTLLFVLVLATLMVPYQVTIIPLFVIVRHIPLFGGNDLLGQGGIGWINSYWGLIVPGAVGAFGIFMLRQFFQTLPVELEDAARIDGAGELRIFWQIMLPLAMPAVATLAIFSFQAGWNAFLWPLLITTTDDMRTDPARADGLRAAVQHPVGPADGGDRRGHAAGDPRLRRRPAAAGARDRLHGPEGLTRDVEALEERLGSRPRAAGCSAGPATSPDAAARSARARGIHRAAAQRESRGPASRPGSTARSRAARPAGGCEPAVATAPREPSRTTIVPLAKSPSRFERLFNSIVSTPTP